MASVKEIREVVAKVGLNSTYGHAKKEFQKAYKAVLPESSFYNTRRAMRLEASKEKTPVVVPSPGPKNPVSFASSRTSIQVSGITELVRSAKKLIDLLGKNEAKKLIDSL